MNTAHTIRFVTTVQRDRALLKSILATLGHQRHADWVYQAEGAVDVIILDADCNTLRVLGSPDLQPALGSVVNVALDLDRAYLFDR